MRVHTSNVWKRLVMAAAICAAVLTALPAVAREPFEIVYQNDGIMGFVGGKMPHFPRWTAAEDITDGAYFQAEADNYADCGVKSISWGLWSGGNSFNHPTKVGRLWADGIPDERMTHKIHLKIKHDLAACIAKGMDPLGEVVKRAKQRGLTITAEMRANNFAPGGTLEKPSYAGPGYNGLIWYETPEWRLTDPYPDTNHLGKPNCNWDWAKPEVRDFNRRVLLEVLHNYDVDGLDINFAQNPPFFNRAEPNKVQHMTGFIKSLRDECDRVGQERGKPIMLTVLLWDSLWGRHHLRDDGLDVATWAKAGLIDRIVVRPTGNTAKYVAMVRGTKCKLYASVERGKLDHAAFAKTEKRHRDAGYDGVFVFNYMIGPGKIGEFRSMNVTYRPNALPTAAPNVWEQVQRGEAMLIDGALQLKSAACFQRGAEMLPMLGSGVTVEAKLRVTGTASSALYGIDLADGDRRVTLGIRAGRLILAEGAQQLQAFDIDLTRAHTLRLTLDDQHEANAYLDGSATPIMIAKLTQSASDQWIRWGHLQASDAGELDSRWESLHYTLEGAYSPAQRQFE
jgi:hypothetical protein